MGEAIPRLPSLDISGINTLRSTYSPTSNQTGRFPFPGACSHTCTTAFRDRLPPVSRFSKLRHTSRNSPNYWAYGTSYLVTLLFDGQLPKSFIKELTDSRVSCAKLPRRRRSYVSKTERDVELWQPKDYKRIQKSAHLSLEPKICEARLHRQHRLEAISAKLSGKKEKADIILLVKAATMATGKKSYLHKQEAAMRKKPKTLKNVPQTPQRVTDIFELTEINNTEDESCFQTDSKSSE